MKRTLKTAGVLALALMIVFTMSTIAFAGTASVNSSKITKQEALNVALKDAGLSKAEVKYIENEYDEGTYEIEFTKKGSRTEYDYEISKRGKILEKSVDYNRAKNYGKKKLTKSDAIDKVASFSGIKKSTIKKGYTYLEKEDGEWVWNVEFDTAKYYYEYEVHANTGKILEFSRELI